MDPGSAKEGTVQTPKKEKAKLARTPEAGSGDQRPTLPTREGVMECY